MARTSGLLKRTVLAPLAKALSELTVQKVQPNPAAIMLALPRYLQVSMAMLMINRERLKVYDDLWKMFEDSPLVKSTTEQFLYDATAEKFTIRCEDKEATTIMYDFLERTEYYVNRYYFLFRMVYLGDVFVQRTLGEAYGRRNATIWTESLAVLPEYTMYRNSNPFDEFADVRKAFYQQIPVVPYKQDFLSPKLYLPVWQVRHARWDVWNQRYPLYGVPALGSARIEYNTFHRTARFMAIARQSSAYRKLVWQLGSKESPYTPEQVRNWVKENLDGKEETPLTEFAVPGNIDVKAIDPENRQLTNVDDVKLLLDVFKAGLLYPLELLGMGAGSVGLSEGEMGTLEAVLKRKISFLYMSEEYELLRPLLEFELALHNKFVKFDIVYKPYALEDQNKKNKRLNSEVQLRRVSRETAWNLEHREIGTWEEEAERLLAEERQGLTLTSTPGGGYAGGGYLPGPENLDKGKKGVERKDPAEQDIADEYGTV